MIRGTGQIGPSGRRGRAPLAEPARLCRDGIRWLLDAEHAEALETGIIACLQSIVAGETGERIKENNVRTVRRVRLEQAAGLELYFKAYHSPVAIDRLRNLILPSRAFNEWRIMRYCMQQGLPTPRAVLFGEKRRFRALRESYFASESIPGCNGLLEVAGRLGLQGDEGGGMRRELLGATARLARRLHDLGVDHRDLHSNNVLVRETEGGDRELFVIDLHSARLRRVGRVRRMRGLVKLAHSLLTVSSPGDRALLLEAYFESDPDGACLARRALVRLERGIRRLEARRVRSRTRRCLLKSSQFLVERMDGFRLYRRVDIPRELFIDALGKHRLCLNAGGEALLKSGRTNRITRFSTSLRESELSICVKEYRQRGLLDRLKFLLGHRRGRAAWRASHGLAVRGVATAEALGFLQPLRGGAQYLVMKEMIGWVRLDRYLLGQWGAIPRGAELERKQCFNRQLARFFAELHSRGIYHGDTKAYNLMVREKPDRSWEFLLLDTDRVVFVARVSVRCRVKNLAQLYASVATNITRTDRFRFFRHYASSEAMLRERKRYYRRIRAECRKKRMVGKIPGV